MSVIAYLFLTWKLIETTKAIQLFFLYPPSYLSLSYLLSQAVSLMVKSKCSEVRFLIEIAINYKLCHLGNEVRLNLVKPNFIFSTSSFLWIS